MMKTFYSILLCAAIACGSIFAVGCSGKVATVINDSYRVIVIADTVLDTVILTIPNEYKDEIKSLDSAVEALRGAVELVSSVLGIDLLPITLDATDDPVGALNAASTNLVESVRQQQGR